MKRLNRWFSEHKFEAHLLTFILLIIPPAALYFAAQSPNWTAALLAFVILGNILAVLIR